MNNFTIPIISMGNTYKSKCHPNQGNLSTGRFLTKSQTSCSSTVRCNYETLLPRLCDELQDLQYGIVQRPTTTTTTGTVIRQSRHRDEETADTHQGENCGLGCWECPKVMAWVELCNTAIEIYGAGI